MHGFGMNTQLYPLIPSWLHMLVYIMTYRKRRNVVDPEYVHDDDDAGRRCGTRRSWTRTEKIAKQSFVLTTNQSMSPLSREINLLDQSRASPNALDVGPELVYIPTAAFEIFLISGKASRSKKIPMSKC
jgi:hypothetical protein